MFDDRYSINASFRTDASNRFGQDKDTRWQPVWSFGARWNAGFEPWFDYQNIFSDFSLRASFGYQGNVVTTVSPDLIATITTSNTDYDYTLSINNLPAPELRQEKVSDFNIGVDFGLFKNKINGTFECLRDGCFGSSDERGQDEQPRLGHVVQPCAGADKRLGAVVDREHGEDEK